MVLIPLVTTHAENLLTPLRKRRREAVSEGKGTWLLHDPRLERHSHPHRRHAECPEQIRVIFAALERAGLAARCRVVGCRDEASDEVLGLVHSCHYLQRLKALRRADGVRLQAEAEQFDDVFLNEHSVACARLAADGVIRMAEALWAGSMHNGLALVRPAGHHAGRFGPSGFCLLNSVAVAARRLLAQGCQRVLIVDWDVHHGDGTQQAQRSGAAGVAHCSVWRSAWRTVWRSAWRSACIVRDAVRGTVRGAVRGALHSRLLG